MGTRFIIVYATHMTKTTIFVPTRIGCPSIPGTMKGIIMSLPGIEQVAVRYEERGLEVTFDDAKINEEAIAKKIGEEMGLAMRPLAQGEKMPGGAGETCPM